MAGDQVVFPVSYLNDSLLIVRAMRQQGINIPAVGAAGYIIPDFREGLGDCPFNAASPSGARYGPLSCERSRFPPEAR